MSRPVTIVQPERGWPGPGFRELWEFREVLWTLVYRDLGVRYKQTILGAAWALIQPLGTMAIFTLFFGRLARIPSDGLPYPLFALAALIPWTYVSGAVSAAAGSVVEHRMIITKVYFPRLILPISPVVGGLVDVGLALLAFGAALALYGVAPSPAIAALPLFLLLAAFLALSTGVWLAALNAVYRDFRFVIPFLLQIWLFTTPIVYSSSLVPEAWRTLYALNPLVGVIEGFRWSLLGAGPPPGLSVAFSAGVSSVLLVSGLAFFRRMERTFVDVV